MGIHAGIYMAAAILSAPVLTAGGGQNTAAAKNVSFEAPQQSGSGEAGTAAASRFVLPEEARVLVIVEGTGGTGCNVYAFERSSAAGSLGETAGDHRASRYEWHEQSPSLWR